MYRCLFSVIQFLESLLTLYSIVFLAENAYTKIRDGICNSDFPLLDVLKLLTLSQDTRTMTWLPTEFILKNCENDLPNKNK